MLCAHDGDVSTRAVAADGVAVDVDAAAADSVNDATAAAGSGMTMAAMGYRAR